MEIPDLLEVVARWDRRVRTDLPPSALWYATLATDGMSLTATSQAFEGRNSAVEHDVRLICQRAGVPYLSPHKLRHGHVLHALKQARNMAELKAISQNVMHASVTITDGKYGNFLHDDVRNIIAHLGQETGDPLERKLDELMELLSVHSYR